VREREREKEGERREEDEMWRVGEGRVSERKIDREIES
jgi:hypothetical protein